MAIGINDQYLFGKFGALTVQPRVSGPGQVAGTPPVAGAVTGEDGSTPISQGVQGVGLGTTYAEGAGSHYTNGMGHSMHTKWLVA